KFDLFFSLSPDGSGVVEYATDLFDRSSVEVLAARFVQVVREVVADPRAAVGSIGVMTPAEHDRLAHGVRGVAAPVPDVTLGGLVERQAVVTPDATAVVCGVERLTYRELNARANRLAHWLIAQGVGPEQWVAVQMPRSVELVVALLAVIKAGGAFVPVDPGHPAARTALVLGDCNPVLVLGPRDVARDVGRYPDHNPSPRLTGDNAAYAIYTSGSTGTPKGVVVTHEAVVNFLGSMQDRFALREEDRLLAVTTVAFDIAVLELFLPLSAGAQVVLAQHQEPADIAELIEQSGITVMQATPSLWQMLLTHNPGCLEGIRVLTGGEPLPADLAAQLQQHTTDVTNLYGPTETTIWSTADTLTPDTPPTIGAPIANTQAHILDRYLQPVPPGVIGELYLTGTGLARGYLNQSHLTADRFT
ncbi:amino acid adenylation domain-containing protein, partial [Streptomyces sp. C184]|uniref:amino acid adenylation domain-containing protein n=1 Tax=Streptomyces sp. C184 TaxID=3237121 RepID=UPI0034C629A5